MRIRATVAAVSGALALSALAVPAAQADDGRSWTLDPGFSVSQPSKGEKSKQAFGATTKAANDAKITSAVVNGGKPIVVGTKSKQTVPYTVTATDDSGIAGAAAFIWIGSSVDAEDSFGFGPNEKSISCKVVNATTTTCKGTITLTPGLMLNSDATWWRVGVAAGANDGQELERDAVSKVRVQRFSKLTVNASPEPVKKGKTITVTGKLTRANWDTGTYKGYSKQSVKLQFKKKGAKSYSTVKTVKTSSTGTLKTTVKASADGTWRYSFAGTPSTPAVSAKGDFLDVK
ncbi:calcium-binding protein [Streptomyces sp. NPDC045714]|uniref:calcium-binding protein n=1 Tax=Streptomyces sp. NPDC045714 TaxID=3154913 RepID=UPI0033EE648B